MQTEGVLKMKNLGIQTETSKASFTNIIQEIEERLLGIEDTIEKNGSVDQKKC